MGAKANAGLPFVRKPGSVWEMEEVMIKIIISPAKKMRQNTDLFACGGLPVFLGEAEELKEQMKSLSYQEAKNLWNCKVECGKACRDGFAKGLNPCAAGL